MSTSGTRPIRRTQQERVAESSERLLAAAIELIAEQGFESTTAAQIGERAGLSRDMVRVRYGSKESLLESLLKTEYSQRMLPPPTTNTGIDIIVEWIESIRVRIRSEQQLMRAFYTLFFEAAGPVPSIKPWCQRWFARCEELAAAALYAAQCDGSARAELDPADEAAQFVSSGVGFGFRWLVDGDSEAFDRALVGWQVRLESYRTSTS
jgi:AcrR family transcriptional regulator